MATRRTISTFFAGLALARTGKRGGDVGRHAQILSQFRCRQEQAQEMPLDRRIYKKVRLLAVE